MTGSRSHSCSDPDFSLFGKVAEFDQQSRRVWLAKSPSLVSKVAEFG